MVHQHMYTANVAMYCRHIHVYVCKGMQGWQCQKPQKLGVGMAVCRQNRLYTTQVTPSLHLFYMHDILWQAIQDMYYWEQHCTVKKRCRDGVTCVVLYNLFCLHCHPYTQFLWFLALPSLHPFTFLENVFYTCLCAFFWTICSTLKSIFFQQTSYKMHQTHQLPCDVHQGQANGGLSTITVKVEGLSPLKKSSVRVATLNETCYFDLQSSYSTSGEAEQSRALKWYIFWLLVRNCDPNKGIYTTGPCTYMQYHIHRFIAVSQKLISVAVVCQDRLAR